MTISILNILSLAIWLLLAVPARAHTEPAITIDRDVVVIGGGSSGTYTAVRLQQMGKSVAVIEREDRLGGHVDTYVDPATNTTFDYGVIIMVNITVVRDYFAYLDIPMGVYSGYVPDQQMLYADFATQMNASASSTDSELATAVLNYAEQLEKYPYLASGFHLPDPVPQDLLIPFGDFIAKYNLSAVAQTIWYINEGAGNILAQPTLYMLKYFGLLEVEALAGAFPFVNANNNFQALYDSALNKLGEGSNVLLNSNVAEVHRDETGVTVRVNTPSGDVLINAKKLVVSIPPLVQNLSPFLDLTKDETALFQQFNNSYLYAVVVGNTGFPSNAVIRNIDPTAADSLPPMPASYAFAPTPVNGLHIVWYGTTEYLPDACIKENILQSIRQVQQTYGYTSQNGSEPEIVEFRNHGPTVLAVGVDVIRGGFYDRANALQGERDTFWTGAAWESHSSSSIWNFTEFEVLPKIMAALEG